MLVQPPPAGRFVGAFFLTWFMILSIGTRQVVAEGIQSGTYDGELEVPAEVFPVTFALQCAQGEISGTLRFELSNWQIENGRLIADTFTFDLNGAQAGELPMECTLLRDGATGFSGECCETDRAQRDCFQLTLRHVPPAGGAERASEPRDPSEPSDPQASDSPQDGTAPSESDDSPRDASDPSEVSDD